LIRRLAGTLAAVSQRDVQHHADDDDRREECRYRQQQRMVGNQLDVLIVHWLTPTSAAAAVTLI